LNDYIAEETDRQRLASGTMRSVDKEVLALKNSTALKKLLMKLFLRNRHLLILDVFIIFAATIASYGIRLETLDFGVQLWQGIVLYIALATALRSFIFYAYGMYARYWAAAGQAELVSAATACFSSALLLISAVLFLTSVYPEVAQFIPRSIPFIESALTTLAVITVRFSVRLYYSYKRQVRSNCTRQNTLIIGAGYTGIQVLDALRSKHELAVIGFLDDDPHKIGTLVRGVRVLGSISELSRHVAEWQVKRVIIAIPSASSKIVRQITDQCRRIGIEPQIMPSVYELALGKFSISKLRPIQIDDLLRRVPAHFETADIQRQLAGKRVLITGAGGSIGMELARQVARWQPNALILLGHGENSLFTVSQRLHTEFPSVPQQVVLADIRNESALRTIFSAHRPEVVLHAAAHKHVPMLETNVLEAVTNNIYGTKVLIELCSAFDVRRMVMLSTDKAVNPTSVMGMTKRCAELLVLNAAQQAPRRFAVVRFGNVLGSRGSVVPIFQQQIANGGPITITNFEMRRFFMSIPEAALLVLKASVLSDFGPLFVLNMGEPVRVLDLARDLIRLNGLEPDQDIEIVETGIRAGEKLCEELFWSYEQHTLVELSAIFSVNLADQSGQRFVRESAAQIEALLTTALTAPEPTLRDALAAIVNMPYPSANKTSEHSEQSAPHVPLLPHTA
jgi:FlaA1/EpsC-like NDP-sugar epimerase